MRNTTPQRHGTIRMMILFFLLVTSLSIHGAPVTQSAAAAKAKAFFSLRKGEKARVPQLAVQSRRKTSGTSAKTAFPSYYIFNHGENEGFVIVSGDDQTADILGYADSGHFDADDLPSNMAEWLCGYDEEIEWARARQEKAVTSSGDASAVARQVIAPLITTKWAQKNPYNQLCRTTGGSQAVTGCVATALAQIMYYHKWPQGATTAIPAYSSWPELPATTFDWDNMLDGYTTKETTDNPHAAAVAQLFYYCGHAVKMSYGTEASSANQALACTALPQYFGYGNTPKSINRSAYTHDEWEEILHNELRHGRPVIYSGNSSSGSGHSFICDGYDGNGFYHINWGWGGISDGYFRLQALNPAAQGTGGSSSYYGYTNKQQMVVGISPQPLVNEAEAPYDKRQIKVEQLTLYSGIADTHDYTGSSFSSVSLYYAFRATIIGNYGFAFGLYQDDQLLQTQTINSSMNVAGTYKINFTSALSLRNLGANLADGTYQVKCLYKAAGDTQWQKANDADSKYIQVTIADGKAVFAAITETPQMEVTSIGQRFDISNRKKVRACLRNNSAMGFEGYLDLVINDSIKSREYVYMDGHSESFADFVFIYTNMAPIHLQVTIPSTSEVIYDSDSFRLTTAPEVPQPEVLAYEVRNLDKTSRKMYGDEAVATVKLKNTHATAYEGDVTLTVGRLLEKKDNGGISYNSFSAIAPVALGPGETKEVTVTAMGYVVGDELWFTLSCAGNTYTVGGAFRRYTVANGYVEWDGNGMKTAKALGTHVTVSEDAAAASLRGLDLSGVTITPNSNPNTLYYLDAQASTPGTLNGKNIVKGSQAAGNITWLEGHARHVPIDFDITGTVAYTLTADGGCDGAKGWHTITLPFAVQGVTADGMAIDWNRQADEKDKDFWVRRYQEVKGNTVYFANTAEWLPNEPYLIGFPATLKEKKIVLSATSTRIHKTTVCASQGSGYQLTASGGSRVLEDAYLLNSQGDAFVRSTSGQTAAGEACFTALAATDASILRIASDRMMGDVNGDGTVSVSDVMLLAHHVMGKPLTTFIEENGDINGDQHITVADVMATVRIIIDD